MRNYWYPRRFADYIQGPELRDLRSRNVSMERDFDYVSPTTQQRLREREDEQRRLGQPVAQARTQPRLAIDALTVQSSLAFNTRLCCHFVLML